ncbi:MAG: polyketide cyclase [Rhodospirillales bacterium 24-66-33]|nr:MAG: polyketide cyclase [Rhodospirillales bacterium 35-66-84]OYZ91824.1 MAG: polyketide cyclase [Rhodospirillales bacterium 24-66-33]OZB23242.1 MAG: polyketide cyclase [Rhodospirillales bacterium 39-66-50]
MLAIVVAVVLATIAAILIYAATRPDSFRVERSATMNAPAEKIFPYIDGLKRWTEWSPYEGRDPAMKRAYSGAESGKGAVYEWDGNDNVGKGRMEIVDSTPPHRVVIKLDFLKPFEGHNMAELTVEPKGSQTIVTWAMYGPSTFMTKLIGTFMDMDDMIGRDFAAGLAKLKTVVEK